MSTTWEHYFDFYMDGKPAPARPGTSHSKPSQPAQGWIARNAKTTIRDSTLLVFSAKNSKQAPFLVKTELNLQGAFTAKIKLRSLQAGTIGISWRNEGQKDFAAEQIATTNLEGSPDWKIVTLESPSKGKTIHLRLLLPPHETALAEITLQDKLTTRTWHPGKH